jgi:hypothetical protein
MAAKPEPPDIASSLKHRLRDLAALNASLHTRRRSEIVGYHPRWLIPMGWVVG